MSELRVQLTDGTMLAVPASLDSITTYVLLEQENWFEKETRLLAHVLRPGMTAIDIGANLGVYSLPMARLVGPMGRVIAYEPSRETCEYLVRSRSLNEAGGLEIVSAAVSDTDGRARLAAGASSELNALTRSATAQGVTVPLTTLDIEDTRRDWGTPDFVKIDAEGEEARILAGGTGFFGRHSPLVMFEVKAGSAVNDGLREAFSAMGYAVYRQLGEAPILVPNGLAEPLDGFELNLFAAKPDRSAQLAQDGVLASAVPAWRAPADPPHSAWEHFSAQPFAGVFESVAAGRAQLDPRYAEGLAAFAGWCDPAADLPLRCAALQASFGILRALFEDAPTFARLSTFARVAWEAGERSACVSALQFFFAEAGRRQFGVTEPFWPACPRYDRVDPNCHPAEWVVSAAMEQLERARAHSTLFGGESAALDWLCGKPFASAGMERRRVLIAAKAGRTPAIPDRLQNPAADHLNADIWRSGKIPGTRPV